MWSMGGRMLGERARLKLTILIAFVSLVGVACSNAVIPATSLPTPTPINSPSTSAIAPSVSSPTPLPPSTPASTNVAPTQSPTPTSQVATEETVQAELEDNSTNDARLSIFELLNPNGPKLVDGRFYNQLLPRDAIRPIYDPSITTPRLRRP